MLGRLATRGSGFVTLSVGLVALLHSASAHAFEFELDGRLYLRGVFERGRLERALRYDAAASAFATDRYQNPVVDDAQVAFSLYAGAYVAPLRWLGFGLSFDSGLVRPADRWPRVSSIALRTAPGRALAGSADVLLLDDRRRASSSGRAVGDYARDTLFVRQAFVRLQAPQTEWLVFEAGRRETEVGGGLIYDAFGLSASLSADLAQLADIPLRLVLQIVLPTRGFVREGLTSPVLEARLDYVISPLESIGVVFASFHDGDDGFSRVFEPIISEVAVDSVDDLAPAVHHDLFAVATNLTSRSSADLYYVGASGNAFIGALSLSGTVLVQLGRLELTNPFAQLLRIAQLPSGVPGDIDIRVRSVAVDLAARYVLTSWLELTAFALLLSGDNNPYLGGVNGPYGGFLGVQPYITRTNLFFSGGLNETFTGRQTTGPGIAGRGVIAGGLGARVTRRSWSAASRVAVLGSTHRSLTSGRLYGVEVDLEGSYAITPWLRASLEYDVLAAGSFFSRRRSLHKLIVGLDLRFDFTHQPRPARAKPPSNAGELELF